MGFISNKTLPRRTFLRGVGATVALPLLESMLPAVGSVARAAQLSPTRFTGIFIPHGAAPGYWVPNGERDFELPYLYKPLEKVRDQLVITSGLWSQSSENPPGVTGADHFVAAAYLCAVKPKKTTGADIECGTTLDQLIAQHIGQDTLTPSLQLAVEDPGANASNCGEGYSCVYTNSISWAAADRPLPMQVNPQVVFEQLFGDGGTATERLARRTQQRSILDSVIGSLDTLEAKVGASDRVRIDQYLEDVREIERRLQIATKKSSEVPAIAMPYGVPESFGEHIKLQFDLLALAFQGDISRVATLLYARDLTGRVYPESGTEISFHGGSHHAEDPGRIAQYAKLNQYHVKTIAYLAEKLRSIPDGDGTLLDHSLILFGSNMGDSNQHLHYDVPHILIGGASGRLKGNRHLPFPSRTVPTGNLLLSIAGLYGIELESFGDSTGRIANL
jgi:hypothetical protein